MDIIGESLTGEIKEEFFYKKENRTNRLKVVLLV